MLQLLFRTFAKHRFRHITSLTIIGAVSVVQIFMSGTVMAALSQPEINAIYNWPLWNPTTGTCSSSSSTTTSTGTGTGGPANYTAYTAPSNPGLEEYKGEPVNGADIIDYLHKNGFTWIAAAGATGSMWGESKWDPESVGTGGWGLMGWTGNYTPAGHQTHDASKDMNSQLPLILRFVAQFGDQQYVDAMNKQGSVADAANIWGPDIERFGKNDVHSQGVDEATQIMNQLMKGVAPADVKISGASGSGSGGTGGSGSTPTGSGSCSSSSTTTTSCSGVSSATGDAKILAAAECYQNIYYEWGGGHQGYTAFKAGCTDPSNPPDNKPSGGPVNGDPAGLSGNPSPCGLDCSGLVSVALDDAFKQNYMWVVGTTTGMTGGAGANYWKKLPSIDQAQPGDIVTIPNEHVEIVVSVDIPHHTVTTFGAHETGEQINQVTSPYDNSPSTLYTAPTNAWPGGAYHWTGPTN